MTAFRAVGPNRACDARSSSPMYASTSTIRPDAPRRRVADRVADEPRAEQRPGRLERVAGEDRARERRVGARPRPGGGAPRAVAVTTP